MIPKVLHFVWMPGLDAMPDRYRRCFESWAPLHPDWKIKLWSRDELFWIHNSWVWDRGLHPSVETDVARFEIVLRYGGVYFDCDQECLRPIDSLLPGLGAFASMRDDRHLDAAGFGATHGHPWLLDVVEEVDRYSGAIRDGLDIDGPFKRATARHIEVDVMPDVVLHGRADERRIESYVVHHRFSEWRGPNASRA